MIDYGHGLVGFILTCISLIHASFALIISLIVIIMIIHHQHRHRLKREAKITLILSGNIYLFIVIILVGFISINIETLLGDVYGNEYNSSLCVFKGYFIASMFCTIYHGFMTQAFFRLCRIVYSNYRWLQLYWFYMIVSPIQVALVFAFVLLLVWRDMIYLPGEHYCYIQFTNIRGMLSVAFAIYGIPLLCLFAIYTRIIMFIRQHSNDQTVAVRRRQKRDLLAVQRIFINISTLIALGLPGVTLLIMCFVNGVEHPLTYRIMWLGVEIGFAVLSVEMVFMTPQLRDIFIRIWRQNRVLPVAPSAQLRTIATAH